MLPGRNLSLGQSRLLLPKLHWVWFLSWGHWQTSPACVPWCNINCLVTLTEVWQKQKSTQPQFGTSTQASLLDAHACYIPNEIIQVLRSALSDHVGSLWTKQIIKRVLDKQRTPSCSFSKWGLPRYPLPMLYFGEILVTSVMRIQYQESAFPCSLIMADAKQCVGKHATSNLQACIMNCTT